MGARQRWWRVSESEGENRMMRKIVTALKNHPGVDDWLVSEKKTLSHQAFYVREQSETRRVQDTTDYQVTIYHRFRKDDEVYLGSAKIAINRSMSARELSDMIDDALENASLILNPDYQLVKGGKRRSWKQVPLSAHPFELLDQIAHILIDQGLEHHRFNAIELFLTEERTRLRNSQGVHLSKTLNRIDLEVIPSYDGAKDKVELYRNASYVTLDFDAISRMASQSLQDVKDRYEAIPLAHSMTCDVLLRESDLRQFFEALIDDYAYPAIYKGMTAKKIGDSIQKQGEGEMLTIGLCPQSKMDQFDADGVILRPVTIIRDGEIVDYYGSNQYARYLNVEPNGDMHTIQVKKGSQSIQQLKKKPHIEIISLSGIQVDIHSGYIGGEVRLGRYFDGTTTQPISGFSFSGTIDHALASLALSKETIRRINYVGPQYARFQNMKIL